VLKRLNLVPFGSDALVFAAHLASLAHIVTRIVMSERLVFVGDIDGMNEPPTSVLLPLLKQHCRTLHIDQGHSSVNDLIQECFKAPRSVFGETLLNGMNTQVKAFAPWAGVGLTHAWLAEYAVANSMQIPFAPNPFISRPIGVHALTETASAEQLLRYVQDIRNKTAKDTNLYEGLHIYDLDVPAIFGAVIRKSSSPEDLIRVASQMNAEAKDFRTWCCNLDSKKEQNPKKYRDQLSAAKHTLRKLGATLDTEEIERTQVSTWGMNLPAPSLTSLINTLNVDIHFLRPRSYLLNVMSSCSKLNRLSRELVRVFGVDEQFAKEATEHLLKVAKKQVYT